MATLGLLSREFPSSTLDENLDAMASTGAAGVQFDLYNVIGDTFPVSADAVDIGAVRTGFDSRGLFLAALSGTYNMIDPDPAARATGAAGLNRVILIAQKLGVEVVTLCTGSRSPRSMWCPHADNNKPDAWSDLLVQIEMAVRAAEKHGVTLAVEPEIGNTINSVEKARRLLDEVRSPKLKIVMDGANIFQQGQLLRMHEVLDRAFDLLGSDIVLAHAKDLERDGEAGHVAAGRGRLDYPHYMKLLKQSGFDGFVILHALKPKEAVERLSFVKSAAPTGYVKARVAGGL